ncbi:ABC transporter permease [Halothermothrix orenii]|uniref:ABC-type antimicrobial peptide transport system, permease component n=1 Tax=Halothermothrix orenii (strain H 168 / OCM 544 / DSM 9562) TaxID=373903 RepID=B8D148_HALOH|nr:ABC transporter permease [Halothermothrix orenii]ACL69017.1 ABC-type antimicrobial peptide transport system, permease component [Halothermothrix orenii H 168]
MKLLEYIGLALYEIWHNKVRTFLTLIGVIIGIAAVIVIIFVVQGAERFLLAEVEKIAPSDVIYAYARWDRDTRRPMAGLTLDDIEYIKDRESDMIRAIAPRYYGNSKIRLNGEEKDCNLIASTPSIFDIYDVSIARGRSLTRLDMEELNQVVVLSYDTAEKLFEGVNPVGKKLNLSGLTFTVIGVLEEGEKSIIPTSVTNNTVFIPFSVFERIFDVHNRFILMARLKDKSLVDTGIKRVQQLLDRRHGMADNGMSKFRVSSWVSGLKEISIIKTVLIVLLSGVASITLLVAGIGLMNIMLVIVTERTREIGLRKALGATNRDILIQFIIESIVLCIVGGILGVIVGYLGSEVALNIANKYINFSYSVPRWAVLLSLTFTTLVGLFFGIYPAYKAARLNPIEALRYE